MFLFYLKLCGIFVTVFHFRQLNKAKLEYINRQVNSQSKYFL